MWAARQLLQHQQLYSEGWSSAVANTFRIIDRCLSDADSLEVVLCECGVRLVRQLLVCVLKVLDCVYDMADSSDYFYTMPICLPWKTFYIIIDRYG